MSSVVTAPTGLVASYVRHNPGRPRIPGPADFLGNSTRRTVFIACRGTGDFYCCLGVEDAFSGIEMKATATAKTDGEAFHGALALLYERGVTILPGWPPAEVQRWLAESGLLAKV